MKVIEEGTMKNILKFTAMCTAIFTAVTATSCGSSKITKYETKHDCGTYTISTFEDIEKLFFEEHTPMKTVAKSFKDFCYYKEGDDSDVAYTAHIPVDMSQFFESEVIVYTIDDDNEEWGEEQTFLEFVKSEKENFEELWGEKGYHYEDLGNGSEAELYIYFNADMELSAWKLYPEVKNGSSDSMLWKTFQKEYVLLDLKYDDKTFPDEFNGKTYDLPYLAFTLYFSCDNGVLSVYQDAVKTKGGFNTKDDTFIFLKHKFITLEK